MQPRPLTLEDELAQEKETIRRHLSLKYGEVLTSDEMQDRYTVEGFSHRFCVVVRKADGKRGSLDFTHLPRFYHSFVEA